MDHQNPGLPDETRQDAPAPAEPASAPSDPAPAPPPEIDPARYADVQIDDDDDDAPTEWVPSRFEKRIHAIPENRWNLYQTLGGALIGAFTVFALFFGGQGLSPLLIVAIVLALFVPNMLENRGRRKLNRGRISMIIVLGVGIIAMVIYTGATHGWQVFTSKQ